MDLSKYLGKQIDLDGYPPEQPFQLFDVCYNMLMKVFNIISKTYGKKKVLWFIIRGFNEFNDALGARIGLEHLFWKGGK